MNLRTTPDQQLPANNGLSIVTFGTGALCEMGTAVV